jgi:iron complex transport system substrate-binding protein
MTKISKLSIILVAIGLISCDTNKPVVNNSITRIITLSPHLAELVYSAGADDSLIGVVAFSDFPESVKSIEQVGDAFKLDYEKIITLNPTHILTWKNGTSNAIIDKLRSLNLNVIETEINTLSDIPKTIEQIAQLTRTESFAAKNIAHFNQTIATFKEQDYPLMSLFIEIYPQPLYTVSNEHWMSEAVSICGYNNLFNDLSQLSAPVTLEAVITRNPQAILNLSNQVDDQWQEWKTIEAVKNNHIISIHPDYFSRPSLRLIEGIKQLCNTREPNQETLTP